MKASLVQVGRLYGRIYGATGCVQPYSGGKGKLGYGQQAWARDGAGGITRRCLTKGKPWGEIHLTELRTLLAQRGTAKTNPTKETSPVVILDVRTPQEFNAGHIPTAINWPLDTLENWIHQRRDSIPSHPTAMISVPVAGSRTLQVSPVSTTCIVYCRSGVRSQRAVELLGASGLIARVLNYRGSWLEWSAKASHATAHE